MIEYGQIYNENCLETMRRMSDEFIDLTVTSPPYDNMRKYNGYSFDFEPIARELFRVTKDGGVLVWVVGDATIDGDETGTSFRQALHFKEIGFRLHDTMIFQKSGTGACGSTRAYWQSFEFMFVLAKGTPKTTNLLRDKINTRAGANATTGEKQKLVGSRQHKKGGLIVAPFGIRENIWRYAHRGNDETEHPAPFPEMLAIDHIKSWSNPDDLIYDPFMGSGTTAKAAHLLDRNWIGSEISQEYCEIAHRRLEKYLIQPSLV